MSSLAARRRHNATGRSTGAFADTKFRKANQPPPGEPFIWITRSMIESSAYRVLSAGGHNIIGRIAQEHMAHGGGLNGALPVTYDDFEQYGIRRRSILTFLVETIVLGFVDRTQKGRRAIADFEGAPALYRLTWLPKHDGQPATNSWMRYRSIEDAKEAVRKARVEIEMKREIDRVRPRKPVPGDHGTSTQRPE